MLLKDVKTCADRMELKRLEEELNQSFPTVIIREKSGKKNLHDILQERFEQLHMTAVDGNPALPEIMYTLGEYGFFKALREERGKEEPEKYKEFLYLMELLNRALTETALMKEEGILTFILDGDLSVMYTMNVDRGCIAVVPFLKDTENCTNEYETLYCLLRSLTCRLRHDNENFKEIETYFWEQYSFLLNLMAELHNPAFFIKEDGKDYPKYIKRREFTLSLDKILKEKGEEYTAVTSYDDGRISVTVCRNHRVMFGLSRPEKEAERILEGIKERIAKTAKESEK